MSQSVDITNQSWGRTSRQQCSQAHLHSLSESPLWHHRYLLLLPAKLHTSHPVAVCVVVCVRVCIPTSPVVETQVLTAVERSEAMLDRKQHFVSNGRLKVKSRGQRVPSVLQRRHGRNWTHKSLWLSHLDEQYSQCLQGGGEDHGYEETHTHIYTHRQDRGHVIINMTYMWGHTLILHRPANSRHM